MQAGWRDGGFIHSAATPERLLCAALGKCSVLQERLGVSVRSIIRDRVG